MKIDFTTTAVLRPEILERTYRSFRDNLRGIELCDQALHIHLDHFGYGLVGDVFETSRLFFKEVRMWNNHSNLRNGPSFPAAVKWCWSQPTTEFFFHLEDDWELTRPFDFTRLTQAMEEDPNLTSASLRAYGGPENDNRILLSPGLFRTTHAKAIAERLSIHANPEKQLRDASPENPHGGKQGLYYGRQVPSEVNLRDIGREWLDASPYRKERPIFFTKWVEKDEYDNGTKPQ